MTLTAEHAAARLGRVTATRVSQIVGLSPWGNPLSCYLDMLGLLPQQAESDDMAMGTLAEPFLAELFARHTGIEVAKSVQQVFVHPEYEWAASSPDRFTPDGPLELKWVVDYEKAREWGEEGTDEVPEYVALQVQWQLATTGTVHIDYALPEVGYVAAMILGRFRWYRLPRHDGLIASLIDICRDFHARTVDRRPPDADWTDPRTPELVGLLHRPREGVEVELDSVCAGAADEYRSLGEVIRQSEGLRGEIKARLVERMGEASVARLPDGRRITRKVISRAAYEVKAGEYVDFRICNPKRNQREPDGNP